MTRPAVLIDTVPQAQPDALPRMDVAAFVGVADAGPVDVPVAVEDFAQFQDLFGVEPILALDAETGEPESGYLHGAVEAFLATGGRRCWVVRVADAPDTYSYPLEGIAALGSSAGALDTTPFIATARSPGIGSAGAVAHTTLIELPLLPAVGAAPLLEFGTDAAAAALQLRIAGSANALSVGVLLRVYTPASDLRVFLVVERIESAGRGFLVSSSQWCVARSTVTSPPDDSSLRSEPLAILPPASLDPAALLEAARVAAAPLRIDRLTFELAVWRDQALDARLTNLEFSPRHPRYFGNLPSDEALFFGERARRADRRDAELLALWDEARGNRRDAGAQRARRFDIGFPSPDPGAAAPAWPLYLPNAMSRQRHPDFDAAEPQPAPRSGNEQLLASLFVDPRLQDAGGETLRRSAESLHNQARDWARSRRGTRVERLRGIHALLPVDEVTMIATPDLTHRAWSLQARNVSKLLTAPDLLSAAISAGGGEIEAEWTAVSGATSYLVQIGTRPDFSQIDAEVNFDAVESSLATVLAHLARPSTCGASIYLRVGARRGGEPSPWSNTRLVVAEPGAFERCERLDVETALHVFVFTPPAPADAVLRFTAETPVTDTVVFEIQSGGDALFAGAVDTIRSADPEWPLPRTGDGVRYFRVRLVNDTASGPWSNTIAWTPPSLSHPILDPKPRATTATAAATGYDDALLLDVHRGLLRFCQARGDLVALLGVPRHYGPLDVTNYLAALIPANEPGFAPTDGRRPLTLGELDVLSYGALFYPWLAHHVDLLRGRSQPRFMPCDGLAAATLARFAIERGAWIAAANRPLDGVLALDPRLPDDDIDALHDAQVNVLIDAAAGFVFMDSETLSRDSDTRSLSVRRLLILIKRLAYREGVSLTFEPNDVDLQERVYTDFERVLSRLHQLGAFKGTYADEAYAVIADATINTQDSIDAGRFIVELRVAPSEPLKFLRVRLTQNGPQSVSVGEL